MKRRFSLVLAMLLAGCVPATQSDTASRAVVTDSALPPIKSFAPRAVPRPRMSNADIEADFLDLTFEMESGRVLPIMTRFEEPITVRVTGELNPISNRDLNALLARLNAEAGIDIARTDAQQANITIQMVPRKAIRRVLPQAACFVVPNVTSLSDFRSARRTSRTNWAELQTRETIAIFIPNDTSPQEVRDCLHEELAQAIGPLNDLYRLPNSVFNDDNVHTVLTGFDMLILKATYAPELESGMSRAEVAARLPAILNRINPSGRKPSSRVVSRTPPAYNRAIQTALGPGASFSERRSSANDAVRIAASNGWTDNRRAFAHYAKGRLLQATSPLAAHEQFQIADRYYASSPDTRLHRAYVATQLASYSLSTGDTKTARQITKANIPVARASQNAALLATLQLIQAEALAVEGRVTEASALRLDSLGWARYGFGPDWVVRAKENDIASLAPAQPPA